MVTIGTVGYGDIVPHTGSGRVLGAVVIVVGVTFISFLNATATSLFVSADQQELTGRTEERHAASEKETRGAQPSPQEARGQRGEARPKPWMRPRESCSSVLSQPRAR